MAKSVVAITGVMGITGAMVRAWAAEVDDLYVAQVPVIGKSAADRDAAVSRALGQVLVKVTGLSEPTSQRAIRIALGRPAAYLQQYRYETVMQRAPGGQLAPSQVLSVHFDRSAVNELLLSSGVPVWSRVRPATLVWLAMETASGRTMVGQSDPGGLFDTIERAANQRGIPLLAPLLDLHDRAALKLSDVAAGFVASVSRASERYGAEAILIGQIVSGNSAGEERYEGRWSLIIGAAPQTWSSQGATVGVTLNAGVNGAADRLAAQFVQRAVGSAPVSLTVVGVTSLEDYGRTLAYLESLDVVTGLSVTRASIKGVSFAVQVRGGGGALAQVIGLGTTMAADSSDATSRTFRLLPGR